MKDALLRYDAKDGINKNIGDYVQSAAAMQFVGSDAILIEREHLHEYHGDEVKLIMNAWWMHYPENFPPSDKINPLFISFHVNPGKADALLTDRTVTYLKKYEPIGCRDHGTKRLMEEKGIKAYFSGCLTLTLGNTYKHQGDGSSVCFVEPYYPLKSLSLRKPSVVIKAVAKFLGDIHKVGKILRISNKMFGGVKPQHVLRASDFLRLYEKYFDLNMMLSAKYISHNVYEPSFKNEKEKFAYTDSLLKTYARAELIVTSRLHAALPGLSMGTPTIFINNEYFQSNENEMSPGRFEGLIEHLNSFECRGYEMIPMGDFFTGMISLNNIPENPHTFIDISNSLTESCTKFINGDRL